MSKKQVFVDTNVILESFRINCWQAICQKFNVETVEKCIEESFTGNLNASRHINVTQDQLINGLSNRHTTNKRDIADLILLDQQCDGLDDGELHLFAWINTQKILPNASILISTADRAAIHALGRLGWLNSAECLEKLIQEAGVSKPQQDSLHNHHRSSWLNNIKTDIRLKLLN